MSREIAAALAGLLLLSGCYGQSSRISGNTDVTTDTVVDTVVDTGSDPVTDTLLEPDADVTVDTAPDPVACEVAPTCPEGPADGVIGKPCLGDGACDEVEAGRCGTEIVDTYMGETYVTYPNGTCQLWSGGTLACNPETHAGCPAGSKCLYAGEGYAGMDLYGCFDACSPSDTSGDAYDWACGCRMGYTCSPSYGMCFTGCSNDRECCETWIDHDDDYQRDDGEVVLWSECESYCDGDDPEETVDCMASYACINPGADDALIGDPCDHDSQCPADGICLNHVDPTTGEEYYPGGYCTRIGCEFAGRGCDTDGGACMNTGSYEEPSGMCLKPCHVGTEPGDAGFECRETAGEQHACFPVDAMSWIGGAPAGGQDGYCMPGNFGSGTGQIGVDCTDNEDCASPLGLGECMLWIAEVPFCTVRCNQELAEDLAVCGSAGTGGVATGLCGWSMCFSGCDSPGAALGVNDCERSGFACAPLSTFMTSTYVAEGATRPPGFCMPACDSDGFCTGIFGTGSVCDLASGVCS